MGKQPLNHLAGYWIGLISQHRKHQPCINKMMKQFGYSRIGLRKLEGDRIVVLLGYPGDPVYEGGSVGAGGTDPLAYKGQFCKPVYAPADELGVG
jgi:hypothetical protein